MSTSTPSRRLRRHVVPVVALAAVSAAGGAALLAGCGSTASAGSAPASIAGYIPSESPVYVQVSTDTSGSQWTNLIRLGQLFPEFASMRAELNQSLAREGINWEKDLKPLLGEAAALATTEVPDTGSVVEGALADPAASAGRAAAVAADQPMLAVLQIAAGKAGDVRALLAKGDAGLKETGTRDGATLYGDALEGTHAAVTDESLLIGSTAAVVKQALDAHAEGGDAVLSGVFRFNDALAQLPTDVFAMAYVNLETVGEGAAKAIPQVESIADGQITGAAAMSVTAEDGGLRMKAVLVDAPPIADQTPYAPTLTQQAPADAIAYIGFNRLAETVEAAVTAASGAGSDETKKQIDALTGQLPLLLGVNTGDLRNLTGGEHAVVVRGSGDMPDAALALKVADGPKATKTLTSLSRTLPALARQFGDASMKVGRATAVTAGGAEGQRIAVGDRAVAWGVRGDLAVIGNGVPAITQVLTPRSAADSLAGSPAFLKATRGMPDQVTGLAYVNMRSATTMLAANGAFEGTDGAKMRLQLRPIRDITAWSTGGETPTVEVFVAMAK